MNSDKKVAEGFELVKQAEKSLKTGVFKWRPDFDVAADEYSKAATAFRIGKSFDQSKDCLLKAVECHKNNKSWFHAAKCLDQIIILLKETNNFHQIEQYANMAAGLYQQHGSPEAAAMSLDKAAKIVEQNQAEMALRFYQRALDIVMTEDSTRHAAEISSKVSRILVKLQMFDQAADAIRREIGLNQATESYGQIGRLAVALVLVQLARGDLVAAEKAFKEWGSCCDAQEVQTLEMLLQAYDDEDPETAMKALGSPFIKHMDVEYAILARKINLPQGLKVETSSVIQHAAPSYTSSNIELEGQSKHQHDDDTMDDNDLC